MPLFVKAGDNTWHGIQPSPLLSAVPWIKKPDNTWAQTAKLYRKTVNLSRTVTNKALTTNVATITTSVAHGFIVGDVINVTIGDGKFDGVAVILSVPLTTTFTYARTETNTGSVGASGTADRMVWQEIHPMLPGASSALSLGSIYRNDRIEIDFSWAAPGSGFTTSYYIVKVFFNGGLYGTFQVNSPTVSMTLTNSSNNVMGFQPYAGQGCTFSVQAFTAGNVGGTVVTSGSSTVINMPTPPTPTSLAVSVANNDLTESWNHTNDNRTAYFYLEVTVNGAATGYNVAKASSVSGSYFPYSSNSMNSGSWSVRVAAVGVNGQFSAFTSPVARSFVGDASIFTSTVEGGLFYGGFNAGLNGTVIDVWYQYSTGGAWNYYGQVGAPGGTITAPGSGSWARDNVTQFRWIARSNNGADLGRLIGGTWCRKMANPYIIHAQDSATWNGGGWQADSGGNYVFQGWATEAGFYWGYGFYGSQFQDQLGRGYVGYDILISGGALGLQLWMTRDADNPPYYANYNGVNGATQIRTWLHDARSRGEATNNFYNQLAPASGAFNKGETHMIQLSIDYFYRLRDGQSRGIGILDTDSTVQFLPPNGTSLGMARMFGHAHVQSGENNWACYVYHNA